MARPAGALRSPDGHWPNAVTNRRHSETPAPESQVYLCAGSLSDVILVLSGPSGTAGKRLTPGAARREPRRRLGFGGGWARLLVSLPSDRTGCRLDLGEGDYDVAEPDLGLLEPLGPDPIAEDGPTGCATAPWCTDGPGRSQTPGPSLDRGLRPRRCSLKRAARLRRGLRGGRWP